MGLFDKIKDADRTLDAQYVTPGHYWVRINKCKLGSTRKGKKFFAVECTVIHHVTDPEDKTVGIGRDMTHMVMADSDYFLSEARTFIAAVTGMKFEEVGETEAAAVFDLDEDDPNSAGAQPLAGTIAELSAREVETRAGNPFTKVSWIGEVNASRVKATMPEQLQRQFFPDGALDKMIAFESEQAERAEASA